MDNLNKLHKALVASNICSVIILILLQFDVVQNNLISKTILHICFLMILIVYNIITICKIKYYSKTNEKKKMQQNILIFVLFISLFVLIFLFLFHNLLK